MTGQLFSNFIDHSLNLRSFTVIQNCWFSNANAFFFKIFGRHNFRETCVVKDIEAKNQGSKSCKTRFDDRKLTVVWLRVCLMFFYCLSRNHPNPIISWNNLQTSYVILESLLSTDQKFIGYQIKVPNWFLQQIIYLCPSFSSQKNNC